MIVKAGGRSALVLATGLFVFFNLPSQAAAGADDSGAPNAAAAPVTPHKYLRHGLRHWKRYAHRRIHRVAVKSAADQKSAAADLLADASGTLPNIPPSVANANAELLYLGTLGENARLMTARANYLLQAPPDDPAGANAGNGTLIAASDQLNDVDRTLQEGSSSSAPANPPPTPVATSESSTWDETSLIGKIFIAFGALLTMASAARMFMA
ncbi:MAG TPA: hypothetical protein VKS24_10355 [Bradyrhizobium sp.]|nr:hypothetical protein [Bradyrhizobium sp.]